MQEAQRVAAHVRAGAPTEAIGPFLITDLRAGMIDASAQEVEHVVQLVHRDARAHVVDVQDDLLTSF